jgi:hypothetical protein
MASSTIKRQDLHNVKCERFLNNKGIAIFHFYSKTTGTTGRTTRSIIDSVNHVIIKLNNDGQTICIEYFNSNSRNSTNKKVVIFKSKYIFDKNYFETFKNNIYKLSGDYETIYYMDIYYSDKIGLHMSIYVTPGVAPIILSLSAIEGNKKITGGKKI